MRELLDLVDAPHDVREVDLAAAARRLPEHRDPGELRRRRPHPDGAEPERRGPQPRPRLPVPPHRAEPARGPADQVGHAGWRCRRDDGRASRSGASASLVGPVRRRSGSSARVGQPRGPAPLAGRRGGRARRGARAPGRRPAIRCSAPGAAAEARAVAATGLVVLGYRHRDRRARCWRSGAHAPTTPRCWTAATTAGWIVFAALVLRRQRAPARPGMAQTGARRPRHGGQ